jgi:hypothetical protein
MPLSLLLEIVHKRTQEARLPIALEGSKMERWPEAFDLR